MFKQRELSEDDITMLLAHTDIPKNKLLEWYEQFKKESVNNCFDRKLFIKYYGMLLPKYGKYEEFSQLVFKGLLFLKFKRKLIFKYFFSKHSIKMTRVILILANF